MALVFKSLNAINALGPGHETKFDTPKTDLSMQITLAGSPPSVTATIAAA